MGIDIVELAVALTLAHLLADFVLQPDAMVRHKKKPWVLLAHIAIVTGVTALALGQLHLVILLVTAATHAAMDAVKIHLLGRPDTPVVKHIGRSSAFLIDQAFHLVVIVILVALYAPEVSPQAWITDAKIRTEVTATAVWLCALIISVRVGAVVLAFVLEPYAKLPYLQRHLARSLPGAGRAIGQLERAVISILVMAGELSGVGFLIAAKSILRFNDLTNAHQRKMTEYVIIGTLLSFGWAMGVTLTAKWLVAFIEPAATSAS